MEFRRCNDRQSEPTLPLVVCEHSIVHGSPREREIESLADRVLTLWSEYTCGACTLNAEGVGSWC